MHSPVKAIYYTPPILFTDLHCHSEQGEHLIVEMQRGMAGFLQGQGIVLRIAAHPAAPAEEAGVQSLLTQDLTCILHQLHSIRFFEP